MSNAANTIPLNGQDFVVLPLNWKQLKALRAEIIVISKLDAKTSMFTEEQQDAILKVVTAAIQRKRSDIKEEFVEEHLDLGNVTPLLGMVFGSAAAEAGATPGEAKAANSQT